MNSLLKMPVCSVAKNSLSQTSSEFTLIWCSNSQNAITAPRITAKSKEMILRTKLHDIASIFLFSHLKRYIVFKDNTLEAIKSKLTGLLFLLFLDC